MRRCKLVNLSNSNCCGNVNSTNTSGEFESLNNNYKTIQDLEKDFNLLFSHQILLKRNTTLQDKEEVFSLDDDVKSFYIPLHSIDRVYYARYFKIDDGLVEDWDLFARSRWKEDGRFVYFYIDGFHGSNWGRILGHIFFSLNPILFVRLLVIYGILHLSHTQSIYNLFRTDGIYINIDYERNIIDRVYKHLYVNRTKKPFPSLQSLCEDIFEKKYYILQNQINNNDLPHFFYNLKQFVDTIKAVKAYEIKHNLYKCWQSCVKCGKRTVSKTHECNCFR